MNSFIESIQTEIKYGRTEFIGRKIKYLLNTESYLASLKLWKKLSNLCNILVRHNYGNGTDSWLSRLRMGAESVRKEVGVTNGKSKILVLMTCSVV